LGDRLHHHPFAASSDRRQGVGESPNVSGVSAFSNAVNDAFAHLGLTHTQMPHDHSRVWKTAQWLGLAAD
jgi:carbon-monoxide dehydrogenase large subunit